MRTWWQAVLFVVLAIGAFWAPTSALAQPIDILGELEKQAEEVLTEDEAEIQRRLAALDAKQGRHRARIIVLPWPDTETTYQNLILQANVRNRIGRPNSKFYPSLDIYQEGRVLRRTGGRPQPPLDQPGYIPEDRLQDLKRQIDGYAKQISGNDDPRTAGRLLRLVDELWFIDRSEVREVLFDLYLAIGRAMFIPQNQTPPYFRMIGGAHANYYLYLAAAMIWEEKEAGIETPLASRLPRNNVGDAVRSLVEFIEDGIHPPIKVAFHEGGLFNARKFARNYKVLMNGIERVVDDTGVVMMPRGRIDISLERTDGFSLSESVEVVRLDDKIYFAMEVAKQKMGFDLLDVLMEHPGECLPKLEDSTRATLATYQELHKGDEIYLAVPKLGSTYDVYIWRWDPETGQLRLLLDRNRGFPVRFALLATGGMTFNGATFDNSAFDDLTEVEPTDVQGGGQPPGLTDLKSLLQFEPAGVPVDFQLRGHFNRLMFGVGVQFAKNIVATAQGEWTERYQVDGQDKGNLAVQSDGGLDDELNPQPAAFVQAFKQREWQRLVYAMIGVVALKDAAFGIGPRAYLRVGWSNLPHAFDVSGHIGFTEDPSFGKKEYKGRVVPLLDLDMFAGVMVPFGDTLLRSANPVDRAGGRVVYPARVLPNIGFSFGTGLTF